MAGDPLDTTGRLKDLGGSNSDSWNNTLVTQAVSSLRTKHSDEAAIDRQYSATAAALLSIAPRDEIEGMMAAQLIAAHNATMECHRWAMLPEQSFEGRKLALEQANKLSRTWATLVDALDKRKGKGQQKVTVEHVHVHASGQAVVGTVEATRTEVTGGVSTAAATPSRSPADE